MNNLPPLPQPQRNADTEHLNLLSIFHFVFAGLAFFGLVFIGIHFAIMSVVMSNPQFMPAPAPGQPGLAAPQFVFSIMQIFYVLAGILMTAAMIGNFLSGFWLRSRRNRMFSIVVACLNCLQIPFGTILGVLTIVVLMRDSVQESYVTRQNDRAPQCS